MGNPVVQWQILSRNAGAHAEFYAKLFQWSVSDANPLGYRMVDTCSERGIPGGFWPAPPDANPFVQLFVEVDDVEACVERTKALGGAVLIPPQDLPAGEKMAILRDPEGMSFGIYRPAVK
ncbi:MAG: VOC family protein [Acidobacteria bacterium]|nr:VOC family protein [Acidobacteriota bacterium]